jgi:UDP-N-acetylmuramoyl-tripeptide--D-alanyl-D-alanine ligase
LGDASIHATTAYTRFGGNEARHFEDIDTLNAAVLAQLPRVASVLVKGSRFMRMERVVETLARTSRRQDNNKEGRP